MKEDARTAFVSILAKVGLVGLSALLALSPISAAQNASSAAQNASLELLGSIETLNSLGFSADDVVYSDQKAHLFLTSSHQSSPSFGIFEITLKGVLVKHTPFPGGFTDLGFSITRSTRGPKIGHFFLVDFTNTPTTQIVEFDSSWTQVNVFDFTGSALPADSIAFNHFTMNLVIGDKPEGHGEIFEVTTRGLPVRSFSTDALLDGLTFNLPTETYFGVSANGYLYEISEEGTLIRTFNTRDYGVMAPVGVASGQGKLFVVDEGIPPNSVGVVYIFKSPNQIIGTTISER